MTKEQTSHIISLEERNKALAEEVQALEFEVKDKDKRIAEFEAELEICENTHFIVHGENQLNIRRNKALEAELQQYKEPVAEFEGVPYDKNMMQIEDDGYENHNIFVQDIHEESPIMRVIVLEAEDEH